MKTQGYFAAMAALCLGSAFAGCSTDDEQPEGDSGPAGHGGQNGDAGPGAEGGPGGDSGPAGGQPFRFAVFSDAHYYDTDLGTSGKAFEDYLALDRKLLAESPAVLDATVEALIESAGDLDFVIVPGDLTKDGERSSHEKFIASIRALEQSGLQVYVCPGNHDINNPDARSFQGEGSSPVDSVTPEQFAELYDDFGYGQALERHPDSLSYLAEPSPGLWVMAIDSCKYRDNLSGEPPVSEISGALSESTLGWIEAKLGEARQKGKRVFGFMHHNLVEHFTLQSTLTGLGDEYVVDDWLNVSRRLSQAGLKLVFTGHYHAQDVTRQSWEGSDLFLFDVETGSLATYPDPFRIVDLDAEGRVGIESRFIESIDYDTDGVAFPDYSRSFLQSGIEGLAVGYLQFLGVSEEVAAQMKPVAVETLLAHYAGDENPDESSRQLVQGYVASGDLAVALLGGYLESLQTDLAPADNQVGLNMDTGEVE